LVVVAEIVAQQVGLLGFTQAVTVARFGAVVVAFVALGVLLDDLHWLALKAAGVFFFDFSAEVVVGLLTGKKRFGILGGLIYFTLEAWDFTFGESPGFGLQPADATLRCACFRLQAVELRLMPFHVRPQAFGGAQVEFFQFGGKSGVLGFAFGQADESLQGMFQFNQRADFFVGKGETRSKDAIALVKGDHLPCDFVQAALAAFNLTRVGALADEPASVDLGVEVAVGVVAADETFAGDGGAVGAEGCYIVTLNVVTEEKVYEGAGSGVLSDDFAGK